MTKIKIGDQERSIKFTFNTYVRMEELGVNPYELTDQISLTDIRKIAFAGFQEASEDEISIDEVGQWLTEKGVFQQVLEAFKKDSEDVFGEGKE